MSLRIRYATYLLFILLLLVIFTFGIVYCINEKRYFFVAALFILLYLTTFIIGRKFSTIFLLLSTLKFIRQNNGVVSVDSYRAFIQSTIRKKTKSENGQNIDDVILQKLQSENIVELTDDTIYLIN